MISIEKLKSYAMKLEFTMEESEYETLQREFDTLLKQVDLIDKIDGIKDYEPLDFPFSLDDSYLREDEVNMNLSVNEALSNCKDVKDNRVSVPKVVE